MTEPRDVHAAALVLGLSVTERFTELENQLHTVLIHLSDLELEGKATLRRVEMLERRVSRLAAGAGGSSEAESGS